MAGGFKQELKPDRIPCRKHKLYACNAELCEGERKPRHIPQTVNSLQKGVDESGHGKQLCQLLGR